MLNIMLWQQFWRLPLKVSTSKKLYQSFQPLVDRGLVYKLRFNLGKLSKINPIKLFRGNPASQGQVGKNETIVVVGIGIAAFTFVRSLHRLGYRNVTIISRDEAFGGKCVNLGCMPSEYYTAYRIAELSQIVKQGQQFVKSLRQVTQQSFQALGYSLKQGEVREVKEQQVILSNGEQIAFDRLVLATGNRQLQFAYSAQTISLQEFWQIDAGKLVIVSEGNVASLSYADIACDRGIDTTIIFTSPPPIAHLPSYQYFQRELEKRDIKIIQRGKIQSCSDKQLVVKVKGNTETISFDHLLYDGVPELNLPLIDGQVKTIIDIDFKQSNMIARPDICVLGDASGFLSATEAELQAKKLANTWHTGKTTSITDFDRLPLRLHARKSLALVGSPWTLFSSHWRSVDFKALGWSAIHPETGKLWYLYNPEAQKVEAIHICHRDASELIALAAVLIDLPVTDSRWLTAAVHPSAAEIFKVVIEEIEADTYKENDNLLGIDQSTEANKNTQVLQLPPLTQLHRSSFYQEAFSPEERSLGILDRDPHLYFAILLSLKQLVPQARSETIYLKRSPNGHYVVPGLNFSYQIADHKTAITVSLKDKQVTVYTGNLSR